MKEVLNAQLPPVRITIEEKNRLQELADQDGRSLSNYVRRILLNAAGFSINVTSETTVKEVVNSGNADVFAWKVGGISRDEPNY